MADTDQAPPPAPPPTPPPQSPLPHSVRVLGNDLKERLAFFLFAILCVAIDSAFLIGWLVLQVYLDESFFKRLSLHGIEAWSLWVFKILFAFGTLAPIVIYIVVDVGMFFRRNVMRLKNA